ncbi:MAG: TatD family hydrolase [Alphaproteobacteria bacterium]|nr:TatD family hydrolase [Alphaproteobacteria bacterium]
MLVDTHCHLVDEYVNPDDVPGIISRARDAGVGCMILPCADPADPPKVLELCDKYDNLFCTVGIHPQFAGAAIPNYEQYLSHPRVIGIGEIGLDYYYNKETKTVQIELFRAQLDIAAKNKLPVAIHSRDAEEDTAEILKEYCKNPGQRDIPGVMHCYTGSWEMAKKMLDLGFYFSTTGIITFKNADAVRDVFKRIPIGRILTETDSPFCTPVPYRGKPCEPFMVTEVASMLAAIHNVSLSELENILLENTKRLYPKINMLSF